MARNTDTECDECGTEFEADHPGVDLCHNCAEDRAFARLAEVEPPEGGWPRGSDMDRI